MSTTISILMPAFNEGAFIYQSLHHLTQFMKTQSFDYEIIVSNDGSWDNTTSEAQRASKDFGRIRIIQNNQNQGKGFALKNAFFVSHGNMIVFLDADLDMPPSQLSLFFSTFSKDNPDIIIGSKRHPNSIIHYPLKRKIMSQGYSFLLRLMFGLPIQDTQTGMKLFKRKVLEEIFPVILCKRFAYDIEILACAHKYGYSIKELPIIIHHGQTKFGGIGLRTTRQVTQDTLAIFYRMYIRRWYKRKTSFIKRGQDSQSSFPSSAPQDTISNLSRKLYT